MNLKIYTHFIYSYLRLKKPLVIGFNFLHCFMCLLQLKVCSRKGERVDVSSYKDKYRLIEGQYTGTLQVQSDSGRGCLNFDIEFRRSI